MKPSEKELLEKYGIIFDTLKEDVSDMIVSKADAALAEKLDFAKGLEFTPRYKSLKQLRKENGLKQTNDKTTAENNAIAFKSENDVNADSTRSEETDEINKAKRNYARTPHFGKNAEILAEKYDAAGFDGFSKEEVLQLILSKVVDDDKIEDTAKNLMNKFGSLENVLDADAADLVITGLEPLAANAITQHRELQRYLNTHKPMSVCLVNTDVAGKFCCERFGDDVVESFYVISLDTRRNVKACTLINRGVEHRTEAYPISILRAAMRHRAGAVLLCHNHPGGNLRPSNDDVKTTQDIIKMLNSISVSVIDHIICCKDRYLSMFDQYQLNF